MATKRAIELGRRLYEAQTMALRWGSTVPTESVPMLRRDVRALERAAIAVGEERERGRQAKRKGSRR